MNFNISAFKKVVEQIEKNHASWFAQQAAENKATSIHNYYYVYFDSKTHLLRFTPNTGLPEVIKQEIKTRFDAYQRELGEPAGM